MSEAAVQQEIDLGIPSLDVLVDRLTNHMKAKGFDDTEIKEETAELEKYYLAYQECQLKQRGLSSLSYSQIKDKHRVMQSCLQRYTQGTIPRQVQVVMRLPDAPNKINLLESNNVDVAYLFGYLISNQKKEPSHKNKEFSFKIFERDERTIKRLERGFKRLGISIKKRARGIGIFNGSTTTEISDIIYTERIPFELLGGKDERRAFLAGYLDYKGSAYIIPKSEYPIFRIGKLSQEITSDLVILLAEFDIFANFNLEKGYIEIRSIGDLRRLMNSMKSTQRRRQIQDVLDKSNEEEIDLDMDTCSKIHAFKKEHPNKSMAGFYEREGIRVNPSKKTTRTITQRVERYQTIQHLIKNRKPYYETVRYCYRTCGVSSQAARALASVYRLDEIRKYKPEDIKIWAQRYDEDNSIEVIVDRKVIQLSVERELQNLARQVATKQKTQQIANKRIKDLARELHMSSEELDRLYFPAYRTALIEKDQNAKGCPSSQPVVLGRFM